MGNVGAPARDVRHTGPAGMARPHAALPPGGRGSTLRPLLAPAALADLRALVARGASRARPGRHGQHRLAGTALGSGPAGSDTGDRPRAGPDQRPGHAGPAGRRRGVRDGLRRVRRPDLPLPLLPGRLARPGRGPHLRDLPARAAPDRLLHLHRQGHRRLVHDHRPQPGHRPREVQPVQARGHDRGHARRRPGRRRHRAGGARPAAERRADGRRQGAQARAAGVHRAALPAGPVRRRDRRGHVAARTGR